MITTSNPPAARFSTALELVRTALHISGYQRRRSERSYPHVDDLDVETVLAVKTLLDAHPEHGGVFSAGAVGDAKVGEGLGVRRSRDEDRVRDRDEKNEFDVRRFSQWVLSFDLIPQQKGGCETRPYNSHSIFLCVFWVNFPVSNPLPKRFERLERLEPLEQASISFQAVKPLGVAVAHGVFVLFGKPLVFVQFLNSSLQVSLLTSCGKSDEKINGLLPTMLIGKGQGKLVAFDANVNAPFVNVTLDVVGDRFFLAEL